MLQRIKPLFLPKGTLCISYIKILQLQVQVGEDTRLQKTVDAVVRTSSMEIILVVQSGEH